MHLHVPACPQLALLPDWTLAMLAFWANCIIQRRRRCRILRVDRAARRIRKPVLLIHGGRDAIAPLETVCSLRKQLRNRPRLWVVSQARHNETVYEVGEEYHFRVARFLTRHACAPFNRVIPRTAPIGAVIMQENASQRDAAPAVF
jgi:pimeloyl-ACP methyl ester carboxylesterase